MLYCDSCTSLIADIVCPICVTSRQKTIENLTSGRWSDCSFLVGIEPHQEVIPGNKLLLAIASPVFDAMFYGPMAQKSHGIILVDDTDPETFKAMLQYIYTCNMKIDSLDHVLNLCYLAKKYMLQHLIAECINYLRSEITAENVQEIYKQAQFFEIEILNKACLEMIDLINAKVSDSDSEDDVVVVEPRVEQSKDALQYKKEVADEDQLVEATIRFKIQNFSDLRLKKKPKELITPPFYVWNLPWHLSIDNDCNDIVSVNICCNSYRLQIERYRTLYWSCWAKSEIRIISNKSDVLPLRNMGRMFDFYDIRRHSWSHEFLTWNELLDPNNEYIKDDALTLEVKLKVEKPIGDTGIGRIMYDKMDVVFTTKRKPPLK